MASQDTFVSRDEQATSQETPTAMHELTVEELREVVGGPIIDNGMGIAIAATVSGSGK